MTKECEVKCKYHWNIVQNKYENLRMLHIWILCGKDLFNMGIYRLVQTKIYFTVCISMYVKPSVPACTWLILQRPPDGCSNLRSVYWLKIFSFILASNKHLNRLHVNYKTFLDFWTLIHNHANDSSLKLDRQNLLLMEFNCNNYSLVVTHTYWLPPCLHPSPLCMAGHT